MADQQAVLAANWAASDGSAAAGYQAADAQAQAAWVTLVAPQQAAWEVARAQAQADESVAVESAADLQSDQQAASDAVAAVASTTADETESTSEADDLEIHDVAIDALVSDLDLTDAQANSAYEVTVANVMKDYGVALAQARAQDRPEQADGDPSAGDDLTMPMPTRRSPSKPTLPMRPRPMRTPRRERTRRTPITLRSSSGRWPTPMLLPNARTRSIKQSTRRPLQLADATQAKT